MKKWEYDVVSIQPQSGSELKEFLNQKGKEGWELSSTIKFDTNPGLLPTLQTIFKRETPIQVEPTETGE